MIRLAYPDLRFNEVKEELKKVIDSGWLTKGPKTEELETVLSKYLKVKYVIAVSSGTAALHLSLLSLGIGPGDEVIVPDFTFPATANAVELCGAKAVLADIELENFNIDPCEIRKKITSRTRAIIPVHQFGTPAAMDEILKIATKHDLYIIEDAACALGAKYRGRMCGTIGDLGCFSFHPRKIITTGEGGAIATNSLRLAKHLRLLREHGMRHDGTKRDYVLPGFNYRISEIASILGIAQLRRVKDIIKKRRKLAGMFHEILSSLKEVSVIPAKIDETNYSIYQAFVVKVNIQVNVNMLMQFLNRRKIEATTSSVAIHMQSYYGRKYGFKKGQFKNSFFAYTNSIALPFHCRMRISNLTTIASLLKEYFALKEQR